MVQPQPFANNAKSAPPAQRDVPPVPPPTPSSQQKAATISPAQAKANETAWYNTVNANNQKAAQYQNTIDAANAGGNGPGNIIDDLSQFGFSKADATSLANWYQGEIDNQVDPAQIQIDLYNQPAFKAQFPEIGAMQGKGLPVPTPADILNIRQAVKGMSTAAGLPPGFITDADITKGLVGGMTVQDFSDRLTAATAAVATSNPQTKDLLGQWYGLKSPGSLAAYYLDPTKALPLIQNQVNAAQIGGTAEANGFTQVDKDQLLSAAQVGATASGDKGGIAQAASELALTKGAGALSGVNLSQSDLLASQVGGNGAGNAQINVAQAQRGAAAKFGSGGNYGTGGSSTAGAASE